MTESQTPREKELWNALSHGVAVDGLNLSASLFFAYRDAWDRFDRLSRTYLSDQRRDWTVLRLQPTDSPAAYVMTFDSPRRDPAWFLVRKAVSLGDIVGFWAFSTTPGQTRKGTIESFVSWARGYWFPRLSYRFMDDLTQLLAEALPSHTLELTEFVVNVFERVREEGLVKQKTTRTWVERDGDREYELYRRFNNEEGRIVTLNGVRYSLLGPPGTQRMDVRIDHRARVLLATPSFNELERIQALLERQASAEFEEYRLRKQIRAGRVASDIGEELSFVEYAGTDLLRIEVLTTSSDWFDNLRAAISDVESTIGRERIVPFVLLDEGNPLFQAQLVDLEGQDAYTVTVDKEQREIVIAPETLASKVESVGKIVNFLQKTVGASGLSL